MKKIKSYKYKNYGAIPQNEYGANYIVKSTGPAAPLGDSPQAGNAAYRQRLTKRQALHPSGLKKSSGWALAWKTNGWRAESASQDDELTDRERSFSYAQRNLPRQQNPKTERGITMKNERTYLKCEICGNLIGMIEDSGISMVCCEQEMTPLTPNTVDAAQEKHVPVAKWEPGKLIVNVGSAAHPMTEEHHIAWIAIAQGELTQRIALGHTAAPTAAFLLDKAPVTVYAYCNLHGLWAAEV